MSLYQIATQNSQPVTFVTIYASNFFGAVEQIRNQYHSSGKQFFYTYKKRPQRKESIQFYLEKTTKSMVLSMYKE